MRIKFEVPDGDCCLDCPHQENFSVEEIECTSFGDPYPRCVRRIVAICHLFNQTISGSALAEMDKCQACKMQDK